MAIIHCPDCGMEISDHAKECPKCHYPISNMRMKGVTEKNNNPTIWLGYVFAFVSLFVFPVLFMIVGIACGINTIIHKEIGHGTAQIALSLVLGISGTIFGFVYELL